MKQKQTIESQLHCKATAELADSIIDDMLKEDGSLKELLDDQTTNDKEEHSPRGGEELFDQ
jgi:hypothetical protein